MDLLTQWMARLRSSDIAEQAPMIYVTIADTMSAKWLQCSKWFHKAEENPIDVRVWTNNSLKGSVGLSSTYI